MPFWLKQRLLGLLIDLCQTYIALWLQRKGRNGLYLLLLIPCVLSSFAPSPPSPHVPQGQGAHPERVLLQGAGEGPCRHHQMWVMLWLHAQMATAIWAPDPGSYPPSPGCFYLDFCYFSTLSRSKVDLFFFSLTLPCSSPITQNKIWPCLSCLSICSQLSITHAWIIWGKRPSRGSATQNISEQGLTSSHGGLTEHELLPLSAWARHLERKSAKRKLHSCVPQPKRDDVCVIICFWLCVPVSLIQAP